MTILCSISQRETVLARLRAADQHAALVVDPDRLGAAERHLADVDIVTAPPEIGKDRLRVGALDLQFAAEGEAARRFGRLLRVEAAVEHAVDEMRVPDGLVL